MPLKNDALETQLLRAKSRLASLESSLGDQANKKQPIWRQARSRVAQIEGRMKSRDAIRNPTAEGAQADEAEAAAE